ncbi:MAG: hypothetical protein KDI06_19030, partial [Calditrichaeota bacterium]|nr:hypothetical protein [Calditrichota bacterium]
MIIRFNLITPFFLLLLVAFSGFPVQAQSGTATVQLADSSASDTLHYVTDEVVVTGTRTAKKIIDIPYPVIRIDQSQFRRTSSVSVDNVITSVPG